jgi:heme-degrading monooxygenase HmoA
MVLASILDRCLRTRWREGRVAAPPGPLLLSYTEFTPRTLRDLPAVYRAAVRLRAALAELPGSVGVTLWWQPFRRRAGSVSAWESEAALRAFVALPHHVEIMRRYRERGTLRAATWREDRLDLRAALARGRRTLDAGG